MRRYLKNSKNLRLIALALGLLVSGVVIVQSLGAKEQGQITKNGSFDSLKNTIKDNKNLIVNSYLLGVSIFKETTD